MDLAENRPKTNLFRGRLPIADGDLHARKEGRRRDCTPSGPSSRQEASGEIHGEPGAYGYGLIYRHAMDLQPLRGYPPFEELIKPKG